MKLKPTQPSTFLHAPGKIPGIDGFALSGSTGLRWVYGIPEQGLLTRRAKRLGARWDPERRFWIFESATLRTEFIGIRGDYAYISTWPVVDARRPLAGARVEVTILGDAGIAVTQDIRVARAHWQLLWATVSKRENVQNDPDWWKDAPMVVTEDVEDWCATLTRQGAEVVYQESATRTPIRLEVDRWLVRLICDPAADASHFLLRHEAGDTHRYDRPYPNGVRVPLPWDGTIETTRVEFESVWSTRIDQLGLELTGDMPHLQPVLTPRPLNTAMIPGWDAPTVDGLQLHTYQRAGVEHIAECGGRALIGDEMGVGKTAQAIAAALGLQADRIIVLCNASARYVWDAEIHRWAGVDERIQHITSGRDALDPAARWVIVTYDLVVERGVRVTVPEESDKRSIDAVYRDNKLDLAWKCTKSGWSTTIPRHHAVEGLSPAAQATWDAVHTRLHVTLLDRLLAWSADMLIADEAHRLKNRDAKRHAAAQHLASQIASVVLLTGTPLRNHVSEVGVLLGLLDPQDTWAGNDTHRKKKQSDGLQVSRDQLITQKLSTYMIRRRKSDVLTQLPPKIREWVPMAVDTKHAGVAAVLEAYHSIEALLSRTYYDARDAGVPHDQARHQAGNMLEPLRVALGLLKLADGQVAESIQDIVEARGCCLIFGVHHRVLDTLHAQLADRGLRVAQITGKTKDRQRTEIAAAFQAGKLDVLIGNIQAAGESLTLTRADTCGFIELDWVPAALLQAEDRGHRLGQRAPGYQILHYTVHPDSGVDLDAIMAGVLARKLAHIDQVLGERTDLDIWTEGEATASVRNAVLDALLSRGEQQTGSRMNCAEISAVVHAGSEMDSSFMG